MDIYLNIKNIIKEKKYITQQEVADKVGVSTNTFSSWMNKKSGLRAEQVPKIAKVLRVSVAELYGEEALSNNEDSPTEESVSFQVDFMQKELDKKDVRIEELIRENEQLRSKVPSKRPYEIAAEE